MDILYKGIESIDISARPVYVFDVLNYCYNNYRPMIDLGYGMVSDMKIMMPNMADDKEKRDAQIGFRVSFDLDQFGPSVKTETGIIVPLMDVSRKVMGTRLELTKYDMNTDNPYLRESFHLAYDFLNAFICVLSREDGKCWDYVKVGKLPVPDLKFPAISESGLERIVRRKVA